MFSYSQVENNFWKLKDFRTSTTTNTLLHSMDNLYIIENLVHTVAIYFFSYVCNTINVAAKVVAIYNLLQSWY